MQMIRKHGLQVLALMMIALIITSCAQGPVTQVTTTPGKPPAKTRVTSEDLMLVDQLMLNRKFEEAVSKIQELQQIEPGNPALEEKLRQAAGEWKFAEAQNLMAVGAYGEAIKKIKSALDLIPQDQRMLYALDEAYLQLGMQYLSYLDAEKAREALNSVQYDQNMKLQAQSLLTTYVPAVEYTKQGYEALTDGNYTMALGFFKAALQLKPGLEQAANGQKAAEAMAQAQPSPTPGYTPSPGTSQPPGEGQITYPTPTPTEEVSTWEKPEAPSGVQDWSNFKSWMENEINRWMSGSSINENPLLGYQSLSLNEDPQAYNYLSESDFANTLYLSAIKIYGERALYIASEIPRLFPLPLMTDPAYQVTQKRIGRLNRDVEFIYEGINGLKAPTIFKETHNKLLDLINEEKRVLNSLWYGAAFPPSGVGDLSGMSQAYVDAFDQTQAKTLSVPFSELPKWAQLKKYYIETGLYAYMLNEVARDFEDMLPLPAITGENVPIYSPAVSLGGISVQLKSSNSSPQPGENLIMSLIAYNSSSTTKFATVRASLPSQAILIDQGAGTYREEGGERYLVWEGLALKPVNAGEEKTTKTDTFVIQIAPNSQRQTLIFKVWLATQTQWKFFTPFAYSGNVSLQLSADNSRINSVDYICQVINSGTDTLNFDLLIPIPKNSKLIGEASPLASIVNYDSLSALKWENQEILANTTANYSFSVSVDPGVSQVVLSNFAQITVKPSFSLITTASLEVPIYRDPWEAVESSYSQLILAMEPTGSRSAFDELVRLVRYAETLYFDLAMTQTPSEVSQVTYQNLLKAAKELAGSLFWIPIRWAQLSQLPVDYLAGYPQYHSGVDDAPNASDLFDKTTGLVDKDLTSFLTLSADLAHFYGTPDTWKDMIEYLRAQLLQRLAELGYR
ncbi:MAG: tetratricopeptide repeat protein [bacterium]